MAGDIDGEWPVELREIRRRLESLQEAFLELASEVTVENQLQIVSEADEQYEAILDCLLDLYECCERQPPPWYTSLMGRRIEDALKEVSVDVPIVCRSTA